MLTPFLGVLEMPIQINIKTEVKRFVLCIGKIVTMSRPYTHGKRESSRRLIPARIREELRSKL